MVNLECRTIAQLVGASCFLIDSYHMGTFSCSSLKEYDGLPSLSALQNTTAGISILLLSAAINVEFLLLTRH